MKRKKASHWYRETCNTLQKRAAYSKTEAHSVAQKLLAHFIGYSAVVHITNDPLLPSEDAINALNNAIDRLIEQEPLQYVLGFTHFYGQKIMVNKDVLIPRSETEEMVDAIIAAQHPSSPHILDLGTGSGCIAISLAKHLPQAQVTAIDICSKALTIAQKNASQAGVNLELLPMDMLQEHPPGKWDIIVSNPPYVPFIEKKKMHPRVYSYEPAKAIFVTDKRAALHFYQRIATIATDSLTDNGKVYAEMHAPWAKDIAGQWAHFPLVNIVIHQDLQGKPRWISAVRDDRC